MNTGTAFKQTILALLLAAAALSARASGVPESQSLNGDWLFRLAPDRAAARALQDFHAEGFDPAGFSLLPVPSNWNLHGFEDPHWVNGTASEGFYLHTFEVPESARGRRAILHFGGVWVSAEVWVNGINLGQHDSGFTAFEFDVSDELRPGGPNRLAVRVRQQLPNNLFKFDANDDWALAGIYRDVRIEYTPRDLYMDFVEVATDFDDRYRDADLNLRVFVFGDMEKGADGRLPAVALRARLYGADGTAVLDHTQAVDFPDHRGGVDTRLSLRVGRPLQWTAETPNLYRLQVDLLRDGEVHHSWQDTVGFREVSTAGGVLRINGEVVKLRGVNRHDQHPDTGRATRSEHWIEDIELMKAANINAIRTAHYPPAEGFIRLCDQMGMYVLNEIPLGFGGERLDTPEFAEGMLLRIHETIRRDRNRPSVIVWDFGNEDPLTPLHITGLRMIKGLDPTRPVLLPYRYEENLPPEVDILAPHYWKAEDYARLASQARRPVITTEYTHALGPDDFGELQSRWDALTAHAAGAGGFIWLWADEGLRRPVDGRPVYHPMRDKAHYTREGGELVREADAGEGHIYDAHGNFGADGIVNADRSPQRDYWETKAVYAPVRVLVDHLELAAIGESIQVPVRNDYDFTNLDAVTLEWKLFRDNAVIDRGTAVLAAGPRTSTVLNVPATAIGSPDPGAVYYLHVAASRDGRRLMRASVRLQGTVPAQPPGPVSTDRIEIVDDDERVEVRVGEVAYVFDAATGEMAGLLMDGVRLAGRAGFAPWRPSTYCERNRYDRVKDAPDWETFMQGVTPTLLSWDLSTHGITTKIRARCAYTHDADNRAVVDYHYTIRHDGSLRVDYTAEVDIAAAPELPEIGLVYELPASPEKLTWLGNGPLDSVPGKTAATCFGWWKAETSSPVALGTKSGLEWARLDLPGGHGLHIHGQQGIRLEPGAGALRVLTHIGGAWTKNGPPENPDWHLDLARKRTYTGGFTIVPVKPAAP